MASRFSRDDQVLEAIFNPENPVGGLDVSKDSESNLSFQYQRDFWTKSNTVLCSLKGPDKSHI